MGQETSGEYALHVDTPASEHGVTLLNGEGWGRDIWGDCNGTKNDDSITMGW